MTWRPEAIAAVGSKPMKSTSMPVPTRDTNRPRPLSEDHRPAMMPCIAGSSGWPAFLRRSIRCIGNRIFTQIIKKDLHSFVECVDDPRQLLTPDAGTIKKEGDNDKRQAPRRRGLRWNESNSC